MFKKGSSLGELFGIKQQQGQQQQQNSSNANSRQQQYNSSSTSHPSTATTIANNNVVPSSIQDLGKVYDRAKDLLEKTRQRNQLGFEENNPDIEKRQFARLNEIRRLTNAMKTSVQTTQGNTMFEDVNEKMAWEQQVKYFEEDLESAVEVAMRASGGATMPNASPMFAGMNVAASNAPEEFAFSPPVNDLRTPPPVATTAPPVVVDLFAGLNVTPTPAAAAASPLPPAPHPEKKKKKVAEEKREIDFERMMPPVQTSAMEVTTTTTNIKTTVEDSDRNKIAHDDDDDDDDDDDRNKTSSSIGFGLQPEALPLDEDAFGDFRDASSAANVPPLPTSAVVEPSVQPLDDEDEDGFFPREEEAVEIPSMEELQQQGGLTSGLDDAFDESDDFLEDYASATLIHEAVISPPAVVDTHPINPPINKAPASANTTMLRIPSFTNEDVPIGNSPGAKRFQQKTKFARETKVSAEALAKGEEEGEEKTKVNSIEAIANAMESERVVSDIVDEKGHFPGSRSPDESPKVSTPVLSPAHSYGGSGGGGSGGDSGSLQTRESTSEPFTPVYSRVTTPTLELSPDAMIPISPGSPTIFNSQDQDFILQNFGIQRVALDLEVADEVDKVVEAAESYVRMRRLSWENAQRLKMEASNKRLSSATNATQHLKRKSELQKQQDDAIRNDDFELAADVEEKLNSLSKQIKDTEDALNAAELQHAERVRASLSALNEWAHAEIEASNNIDKFVSDKEEKWAREKEEEEARKKVAAAEAAAAASSNNTSSEHERLVLRATETEDALKLAVEKSRENEAKTSEIEDERKAVETKVNELKEALQIAEDELEHLANKVALESANAEKANRLVSSCRETHETSKAALESYNEKVREEVRKEAQKQQMQGGTSSETEELIGKMKERSELYRRAGSERLQTTEESSISDELQQLVIHETTNTILSSEAQSELKREESDNARINADLANALSQERDCLTRLTILERRKNELLALKQSHAAAKSFKEASECVNELNAEILPELEQLNTLLVQKKRTVESLQLQFSESETKVGLCREKFREAEKVCAQSRKVRLQTELNNKNSSKDESEVEALKCALELLVLKHPEV
jgi:hypothetical protein